MVLSEILFTPKLVAATGLYLLAIITTEIVVARLHAAVHGHTLTAWMVERLLLPLTRAAALLLFILTAYPLLFATIALPPLSEVLFGVSGRTTTLLNIAFLMTLLLPLAIPVRALALPLQGIALSALLFNWATVASGPHSHWPGSGVAIALVAMSYAAHWAATAAAHRLGLWVERTFRLADSEQLAYEGLLLLLQGPIILLYTTELGRQIMPAS